MLVSMAQPALALLDEDLDGLFDVWERQFGFSDYGGSAEHKDADPDGDGASNLAESLAGTDPQDPTSRMTLTVEANLAVPELRLRFATVGGKRYRVEQCASLSAPAWEPVGSEVTGDGAPWVVVTTLPLQEGAHAFFRLMVLFCLRRNDLRG
jgi:hypothetical protein